MSFSRTVQRVVAIMAVTTAVAMFLPMRLALAASEPPFELSFPQETQATTHHNDWGARRSGGRRHKGNDLMAPKMTQVYSIYYGYVERIATSARAGRYIEISHVDGWSSMYVHLNNDNPGTDDGKADWSLTIAPGIEEGSWVRPGQLIGWVGDSGNAEGSSSHTHFELLKDGQPVNPYPYLRDAWERDHHEYLLEVLDLDFLLERQRLYV